MSAQDGTCSEGNAQQGYPSLCKNGCGFFSSVDAKGFCSVCYKDFLKKQSSDSTEEVADAAASLSNLNVSVEEAVAAKKEAECTESHTDGAVAKSVVDAAPEVVEKSLRLLQEKDRADWVHVQVWWDVLWYPSLQRQTRLRFRLQRHGEGGDSSR